MIGCCHERSYTFRAWCFWHKIQEDPSEKLSPRIICFILHWTATGVHDSSALFPLGRTNLQKSFCNQGFFPLHFLLSFYWKNWSMDWLDADWKISSIYKGRWKTRNSRWPTFCRKLHGYGGGGWVLWAAHWKQRTGEKRISWREQWTLRPFDLSSRRQRSFADTHCIATWLFGLRRKRGIRLLRIWAQTDAIVLSWIGQDPREAMVTFLIWTEMKEVPLFSKSDYDFRMDPWFYAKLSMSNFGTQRAPVGWCIYIHKKIISN